MHDGEKDACLCNLQREAERPWCRRTRLAAAMALCFANVAHGATITVSVNSPGTSATECTLSDAVAAVNAAAIVPGTGCGSHVTGIFGTSDTINFLSPFTITFTTPPGSSVSALLLTNAVTIDGGALANSVPRVTLERSPAAASQFRLIETNEGLTLSGLTIRNGAASDKGGGISSTSISPIAVLRLMDSVVTGNNVSTNASVGLGGAVFANNAVYLINSTVSGNSVNAPSGKGGGIYSHTVVRLDNSTIGGNSVTATSGGGSGGAIVAYGNVYLTSSTISRNSVSAASGAVGGGICNHYYKAMVSTTNSTISSNRVNGLISSSSAGGGIFAYNVALNYSTITGNSVPSTSQGGGVALIPNPYNGSSTTVTLISANTPNDVDANAPIIVKGDHNIVGNAGSNVSLASLPCTNVMLGPLGKNGGLTKTHGLLNGSCAVDVGPATSMLTTDQRGTGFLRKIGTNTDVGAFEKQGPEDPDLIFADDFEP